MRARAIPICLITLVFGCNSAPGGGDDAGSTAGAGSTSLDGTSTSTSTSTTGGATTDAPTTTGGASSTTAGATSSGEGTGDTTTGGPAMSDDEVLLRQAIAGEVDAAEAMQTISERGGFPVEAASGGFLFACLCGQGEWTLAGDHNGWTPEPMELAGELWWTEAEVPEPDGSLYKFHEPVSMKWVPDPYGRRYGFDQFGRYTLVRASAAHLERWFSVSGAQMGLAPRDLQVHVPAGGAFTHALYVHDGQNLFDPDAPWGGWKLQESVPPGVLVVGIDNTFDRLSEYTHVFDVIDGQTVGGKAGSYAMLLDEVVRPRIEAAYGPAEVVGTMGSSLGGLVSLVIADLYPGRYDMAISLSGTLGWGSIGADNETILDRYMQAGEREFSIYLDSGGDGTCADLDLDGIEDDADFTDNYCTNAQMYGILQQLGYEPDVEAFYVHEAGAPHNEAAWAARVGVPMQYFSSL